MKKLIVFDFVTHMGGAQKATVDFLRHLKAHGGYEISFVDAYGASPDHVEWVKSLGIRHVTLCSNEKNAVIGGGAKILRVAKLVKSIPGIFFLSRKLKKQINKLNPEIVLVTSYKSLFVLKLAFLAVSIRAKVIYWCHGNCIPRKILKHKLDRFIDKYFCLSETVKLNSVVSGFQEGKIGVISNAIDIEQANCLAQKPLIAPLPNIDKPARLLVPATLLPAKGQDCAIRALGRLVKGGCDAVLYLAGDCGKSGHQYAEVLASLASKEGVSERVHFLGWRTDVMQIMKLSTVVVLPSHSEGMPLCLLEAMSLQVPIIATRVGSIPEMLSGNMSEMLIDIDDDDALCEKVEKIHSSTLCSSLTDDALRKVLLEYSYKNQIESFVKNVT